MLKNSKERSGFALVWFLFSIAYTVVLLGTGYNFLAPFAAAIAAEIDRFYREGKAAEFRANILRFRERFTWERMIGNFRSLYDRIAGTQPGQKR